MSKITILITLFPTFPANPTKPNQYLNNIVVGNDFGGLVNDFRGGHLPLDTYAGNIARSNGLKPFAPFDPTCPLGNYFGILATNPTSCLSPGSTGTPIRLWCVPNAPCPTDNNGILDPLDNLDIRDGSCLPTGNCP